MTKPENRRVAAAEKLKDALGAKLEVLARKRLEDWAKDFKKKFPRQHGRVRFGMGSEYVEFGGKQYNSWDVDPTLKPFFDAIEDVWSITDNYRMACPEDFSW